VRHREAFCEPCPNKELPLPLPLVKAIVCLIKSDLSLLLSPFPVLGSPFTFPAPLALAYRRHQSASVSHNLCMYLKIGETCRARKVKSFYEGACMQASTLGEP
jgi:hypothetical protein